LISIYSESRRVKHHHHISHNITNSSSILGGNPELVKASIRARFGEPAIVDEIIELDNKWREGKKILMNISNFNLSYYKIARFGLDKLNKALKDTSKAVGDKKKINKEDPCEVSHFNCILHPADYSFMI
jgi:seryl-tRNA synthetase